MQRAYTVQFGMHVCIHMIGANLSELDVKGCIVLGAIVYCVYIRW